MSNPQRILVVDDNESNRMIIGIRLKAHGYEVLQADDGEKALAVATEQRPDLILLDIMMPKIDGIEVCRRLKSDAAMPFTPIILVTAKASSDDVVVGLEAGADEYLTKPIDQTALVARVKSVLRIKELHDQVRTQAAELASWNKTLERRVEQQLGEIERVSRLKSFLSPQIVDAILSHDEEKVLESHRRDITVVFCDLRGFTRFAESVEPEELIAMLNDYHARLGELVHKFEGTVERFTGDGLMIWFNDPLPCPDPCERAVKMAVEMREAVGPVLARWHKYGHDLGFGMGIARGYATMGRIGFKGRFYYSAIGTVVNLAARLCGQAEGGQILIDGRVCESVEVIAETEPAGELSLKGVQRPLKAYNVRTLRT
jgi:class 3 adenylate cyclase/CheY-like chemotaxis protein